MINRFYYAIQDKNTQLITITNILTKGTEATVCVKTVNGVSAGLVST